MLKSTAFFFFEILVYYTIMLSEIMEIHEIRERYRHILVIFKSPPLFERIKITQRILESNRFWVRAPVCMGLLGRPGFL